MRSLRPFLAVLLLITLVGCAGPNLRVVAPSLDLTEAYRQLLGHWTLAGE